MSPAMADLDGLIERLEKASGWQDEQLNADVLAACGALINPKSVGYGRWPEDEPVGYYKMPYVLASIDAALALVERLLPGWDWILEHTNGGLTISCLLGTADPDKRVFGDTPALAILLALLKALRTQPPHAGNDGGGR